MNKRILSKTSSMILAAALCANMFSVMGGSLFTAKAESGSSAIFTADSSEIKDGVINTDDSEAVSAIEKNFYVYNAQRKDNGSFTSYF